MAQIVPTKGNLMATKKSLVLAELGYDLMDRKRNILIREMMQLIDKATQVQERIDSTYGEAYAALQKANLTLGFFEDVVQNIPVETGLSIDYRSVMGVEIPTVRLHSTGFPNYPYSSTNSLLDIAYERFQTVKELTAELAEIESSVYLLAVAIRKTQKRANALKNIMIPSFRVTVKTITEALEEKEREDFSRLKVIKMQKTRAAEKTALSKALPPDGPE